MGMRVFREKGLDLVQLLREPRLFKDPLHFLVGCNKRQSIKTRSLRFRLTHES